MEVVLVRHGETAWSLSRQHTGRTDIPLTDNGRTQARALAPLLAGRAFAHVLASPLVRAWETAELCGIGGAAEREPDLQEWDYGDYEGRTTAEILTERRGWNLWRDGCPHGEHADAVALRADRVLARVAHAGGDVALVAHGHLLRVLAARWLGLEAAGGALLALDTATVSVLGHEHARPVIRTWNRPAPPG